jgi:hypothetical protein
MKPPTDYDPNDVQTGEYYDGPLPTPGPYKGVLKKMLLTKKNGEQRIMVVCEISEGKFKGAGVTKWLQLTKQGSPWVNQFLHSLTDGSEAQMRGIRKAFNEVGYEVGPMDDKKRLPIVKIGSKTQVSGRPIAFVVKHRTNPEDNITRAEVARFIIPRNGSDAQEPEDVTPDEDDAFAGMDSSDDGMDEFASETTSNPEPENETHDLDESSGADEDDPWSVG